MLRLIPEVESSHDLVDEEVFINAYEPALEEVIISYNKAKKYHDVIMKDLIQGEVDVTYKRALLFFDAAEIFYDLHIEYHRLMGNHNGFLIDNDIDGYETVSLETADL